MTNPVYHYVDARSEARAYGELRWQVLDHHRGSLRRKIRAGVSDDLTSTLMFLMVDIRIQIRDEVGPKNWDIELGDAIWPLLEAEDGE